MGASSVPSDIVAIFALIGICIIVLLVLRQYLPLRLTPGYLLVSVFLALALPSSIILLVPIDLASSSGTDTGGTRGVWLPDRVMLVWWRITYWLTFVLTWLILPLLGEYMDSGYREPRDRIKDSLRNNARYQLTVLAVGTAGAVYFFLQSGFEFESLKALVMALAYSWGLILAIYLMGHGLVAIPRRLIRDASVSGRLKALQVQAPKVHERLEEAIEELDMVEGQITVLRSRKPGLNRDMAEWVDELYDSSSLPESRPSVGMTAGPAPPAVVTDRYLAQLSRKVKRARHKKARFISEWDILIHQAARLQAIIDSSGSKRLTFTGAASGSGFWSRITLLTPLTRYHWHTHALPFLRLALGLFLACISAVLIWSETIHLVNSKLSVVGLSVVHHPSSSRGQIGFAGQLIAGAWLLYMCTAALYSVTEVKVWGNRALVRRQTYAESACWYSMQVAKLTVPLSFNFITMMPRTIYTETMFYRFLGRLINLTPAVGGFSDYFPIFILVPVLATLFNLYGKVKNVVGFGVGVGILDDEDADNTPGWGTGGWREGRALIERELQSEGARLGGLAGASSSLLASAASTPPLRRSLDLQWQHHSATRPSRATNAPTRAGQLQSGGNRLAGARRGPGVPSHAEGEEEDEAAAAGGDRYFFQDFTERMRNTLDTTERPAWLRGIGEGIQKPRWMSGGEGGSAGASGGASSGGSSGGGGFFGKLFGGGDGARGGGIRI